VPYGDAAAARNLDGNVARCYCLIAPIALGALKSEAALEAALAANAAIRVQAERLMAAYAAPESDRAAIINELINKSPAPEGTRRGASNALGLGGDERAHASIALFHRSTKVRLGEVVTQRLGVMKRHLSRHASKIMWQWGLIRGLR
jgi:hypothetical protein